MRAGVTRTGVNLEPLSLGGLLQNADRLSKEENVPNNWTIPWETVEKVRTGGRGCEQRMDGHTTPSKNNKERQHGKVGRHMGPERWQGVRGCWLACICREKSACFSAPQYPVSLPPAQLTESVQTWPTAMAGLWRGDSQGVLYRPSDFPLTCLLTVNHFCLTSVSLLINTLSSQIALITEQGNCFTWRKVLPRSANGSLVVCLWWDFIFIFFFFKTEIIKLNENWRKAVQPVPTESRLGSLVNWDCRQNSYTLLECGHWLQRKEVKVEQSLWGKTLGNGTSKQDPRHNPHCSQSFLWSF